MSDSDIVIIGACGFGKETAKLAKACGRDIKGFLDDDVSLAGQKVWGLPVLGTTQLIPAYSNAGFVVAVGSPSIRKSIVDQAIELSPGIEWATLVHPSVELDDSISLGEGSIVTAGCTLTVDIHIGRHCIVNINSTVGHDCNFGDFVTVAPLVAISGNTTLESLVEIGTGAAVRQGVTIRQGAMLGMGGVLTKNQPSNTIFVGNPAKELQR